MMVKRYLELAASKATTDEQRIALLSIIALASELKEQEQAFAARIHASKAVRGEGLAELSTTKRRELDQYALNAREMEEVQMKEFESFDSAWPIVFALHMGLDSDVGFWSKSLPKEHPSDVVIVHALAQAKARLRDALTAWLSQFPDEES